MDDLRAAPPSLTGLTTYLLSRTGKIARSRLAGRFAERGLRLWHHAVLAALADFGPHVQRDLAARLGIDPSDMAKIVDELASGGGGAGGSAAATMAAAAAAAADVGAGPGYVERARDAADRRRVTVTLTEAGRTLLAELDAEAAAVQDDVLEPLTGREREQLDALLRKVFTHLVGEASA